MPATFARERAYLSNARAFGRRWDYLGLVAVSALVLVALLVVPAVPMRQLMAGFVVGAVAMAFALSAARFDHRPVRGYLAETFSVESLRKVPNWLVVDNLPFEGVDVDHVAVTPSGVLAVQSKHHHRPVSTATARRDLDDARRAATKIRLFLASEGHAQVAVTPVLMIWGPGSPQLPQGVRLVDEVYLVDPDHPELWSYQFAAPCSRRRSAPGARVARRLRAHAHRLRRPSLRPAAGPGCGRSSRPGWPRSASRDRRAARSFARTGGGTAAARPNPHDGCMELTKYAHSCIRLDDGERALASTLECSARSRRPSTGRTPS